MAFKMKEILTGVGVGIVDEVAEWGDTKKGYTNTFRNFTDIYRAVAVVGGSVLSMFMPRYAGIGEDIAQAATPLLTKSVVSAIRGSFFAGARPATFASRRRVGNTATSVARSYEPEFSTTGIL